MNARRSSAMNEPSPWYALHEYLVVAYSNPEMRRLVEISLLPEAGHRLPDERVPAQEYASALCTLIQRHSSVPSPEFWRRLLDDRPMRRSQIVKLRSAFSTHACARAPVHSDDRGGWWRKTAQALAIASIVGLGSTAVYCANAPPSAPAPAPAKQKVECNDGTFSPTCDEPRPGCCSSHGGVRVQSSPAGAP